MAKNLTPGQNFNTKIMEKDIKMQPYMDKQAKIDHFCSEARNLVQKFTCECAEKNFTFSYDTFALWLSLHLNSTDGEL
jgi:hypothetical protein